MRLPDVLKALGEGAINRPTDFLNRIYETGQWPEDFLKVIMIPTSKNTHAKYCKDCRTTSLMQQNH